MGSKVNREDVEDDIQSAVWIEIEVANKTNDFFPYWTCTFLDGGI